MKKLFSLLTAFLFFPGICLSQGMTAAVHWEKYSNPDQKISIVLPKMPTVVETNIFCTYAKKTSAFAYADGAVYEFTIYSKSNVPSIGCWASADFDKKLLLKRINQLNAAVGNAPARSLADKNVLQFSKDDQSIWLVPEMAKDRWIELAIYHAKDTSVDEQRFVRSLDLTNDDGKTIGDGSESTVGDADIDVKVPSIAQNDLPSTPPKLVAKPKALYTEEARRHNIEGGVMLRVTLLRNGSVGSVQVVTELKYGLTEQAVAAAKRIVFLPKRVGGVPINTVMTFEYQFSIL